MRLTRKQDTPRQPGLGISRRQFLKRSGVATGSVAAAGFMGAPMMRRSDAADKTPVSDAEVETKRTICSHCSVGCGTYAEVQEGVWTRQEPAFDHPINRGTVCPKAFGGLQLLYDSNRVKGPMVRQGERGRFRSIGWDEALKLVTTRLSDLRAKGLSHTLAVLGGQYRGYRDTLWNRFGITSGGILGVTRVTYAYGALGRPGACGFPQRRLIECAADPEGEQRRRDRPQRPRRLDLVEDNNHADHVGLALRSRSRTRPPRPPRARRRPASSAR